MYIPDLNVTLYKYCTRFCGRFIVDSTYFVRYNEIRKVRFLDLSPDRPKKPIIFSDEWNNWKSNLIGNWSIDEIEYEIHFDLEDDFLLYNLTFGYGI